MKQKASLTVEAVIAFVSYLSFMFMLLLMVKMSMVSIVLNGAVNETAKQIATMAYPLNIPIAVANDQGDKVEVFTTVEKNVSELINNPQETILEYIFENVDGIDSIKSGDWKNMGDILMSGGSVKDAVIGAVISGGEDLLANYCANAAAKTIQEYVNDSKMPIRSENIKIRIVKLPMSDQSYKNLDTGSGAYSDFKLTKDDFDVNDVVIAIEYSYVMNLPFLDQIRLTLRDVAVEQAWVNGCSSMRTWSEGIKIEDLHDKLTGENTKYWIAGGEYGNCYHKQGCPALYRKNALPVSDTAGKKPCKRCNPAAQK